MSRKKSHLFWGHIVRCYTYLLTVFCVLGGHVLDLGLDLDVEVLVWPLSITLARPSVSSSLQITNRSFTNMHHLTCGISSLLHSVNLILVHLILRISPHHSHHPRFHHLSLPVHFTPDLKLISFTNPFLHSHLIPSGLTSLILTCAELKGHWRCLF